MNNDNKNKKTETASLQDPWDLQQISCLVYLITLSVPGTVQN
jgi:hypothetical protein